MFYLYFEAFPIVFPKVYNFTISELGLSYIGFFVGCILEYGESIVLFTQYAAKMIEY